MEFLSPRQVASAIGVSESSIRRWADNGQIQITRTSGGHRKIAVEEAMRFIRQTSATVVHPEILGITQALEGKSASTDKDGTLLDALREGDGELVSAILTRMYVNGLSVAEICDGPLRNALQQIGEMWPDSERSILIEHRATSICIDALGALKSKVSSREKGHCVAIGGAPADDPYIVPSLMVSTVLAELGFSTTNLGPNTPLNVLTDAALEMKASVVWLACTAPQARQVQTDSIPTLVNALGSKSIHVVLGGQSAAQYDLTETAFLHRFKTMSEMSGFAKALIKGL